MSLQVVKRSNHYECGSCSPPAVIHRSSDAMTEHLTDDHDFGYSAAAAIVREAELDRWRADSCKGCGTPTATTDSIWTRHGVVCVYCVEKMTAALAESAIREEIA